MIRITATLGLIATLLGACSNTGVESGYSQFRSYIPGQKNVEKPVSARYKALFDAGPQAGVIASFPDLGKPAGMLREAKTGTIESFLGNDEVSIVLDRGLLVGTRGTGSGMLGSEVGPSANLILSGRSGTADRIHTFLVRDNKTDIRAYRCQISHTPGTQTIKVNKRSYRVRAASETCANNTQKFENTYLIHTGTNRIIRSSQWSGPFRGNLSMDYVTEF